MKYPFQLDTVRFVRHDINIKIYGVVQHGYYLERIEDGHQLSDVVHLASAVATQRDMDVEGGGCRRAHGHYVRERDDDEHDGCFVLPPVHAGDPHGRAEVFALDQLWQQAHLIDDHSIEKTSQGHGQEEEHTKLIKIQVKFQVNI